MVKLDKKDLAILYELDVDARQSYSQIGRKVRLSKEVVKYRVDRLLKENVISQFALMIDGPKLGYIAFKFYIRLQNMTMESQMKMIENFVENQHIGWVVTCDGKFDLIVAPFVRNGVHAFEVLNEILGKYNKNIRDVVVLNYIDAFHQKRIYLTGKKERTGLGLPFWGNEPGNYGLDKYEKKILFLLSRNARTPVTELADKIGISVDVVHSRIKKLTRDKVIQGARIVFDKSALGYEYYKLMLNVRFYSKEEEKKFYDFLRNEPNVIDVIRMMGAWNFELDIDVINAVEFHEILMKLKNRFAKNIQDYDSLLIFEEHKYDLYPFKFD